MHGAVRPHGQMSDSFRAAVCIILSGGFQDAYSYTCRGGVFANAQTGNIVLLSAAAFRGEWRTCLNYLIPVCAFLLGTAVAEAVHVRLKHCQKLHWRQIILLGEIVLLLAVGFLGERLDPLANAVVSFVCALQVQSFHKIRGHAYASTMCIGNMRSGVEALCAYLHTREPEALRKAVTYFGVLLVFAAGAGVGCYLALRYGDRSVWCCCGLLAVSFCMMFVSEEKQAARAAGQWEGSC